MATARGVTLSVIVPAYNEAPQITKNLRALDRSLGALERSYEIIVVDDASQDETAELVRAEAHRNRRIKLVEGEQNQGKGVALRRGFERSTGVLIGFIDADMDLHPKYLNVLIKQIERDRADIAVGSKLHPHSEVAYPTTRRFMSFWYRLLIRMLFRLKVRDTQVGLKVFNRSVLEEVMPRLLVKRFAFDVELLAVAQYYGYTRVIEAPIKLDYQFSSTVRAADVRGMLLDTLAVFYRLRIRRYYQAQKPEPAITIVSEGTQLSELDAPPVAGSRLGWLRRRRRK